MVESTGLENRRIERYPGFESLSLRHLSLIILNKSITYTDNRAKRSFGTRISTHNYFQSQLYFYPTHHPLSAYQHPTPGAPPTSQEGTPSIGRYYFYGWVRYSLADITIYASQISLLSFHSSERRQNKPSQLSRIAQRSLRLSF